MGEMESICGAASGARGLTVNGRVPELVPLGFTTFTRSVAADAMSLAVIVAVPEARALKSVRTGMQPRPGIDPQVDGFGR